MAPGVPEQSPILLEKTSYTLTIIIDGIGTTEPAGAPAPGASYTFPAGTFVYVFTRLGSGAWAFSHWTGDIGTIRPTKWHLELLMDQDRTVTAHFLPAERWLTVSRTGIGGTYPEPGVYSLVDGTSFEVVANVVSGGHAFSRWTGDIPPDANPFQFDVYLLMDQDRSVCAEFVPGDFILTVREPSVTTDLQLFPAPGVYAYLAGGIAWTEARPTPNGFWGGWIGDVSTQFLIHRFVMDDNKTLYPIVRTIGRKLRVDTTGLGMVLPPQQEQHYTLGATPVLHAGGNEGQLFAEWTGDVPEDQDPANPDLPVYMDRDRAITAHFVPPDWILKLRAGPGGITDPDPADHGFLDGHSITVEAVPQRDMRFLRWEGDVPPGMDPTAASLDIVMDCDRGMTAVFAPALVSVPDVGGMPLAEAQETLADAGLVVNDVVEMSSCLVEAGRVMRQRPEPGQTIAYGGGVDLMVSNGDCDPCRRLHHAADDNRDYRIDMHELLRVIQFYNSNGLHCSADPTDTEDGYKPGPGTDRLCCPHSADYLPAEPDWIIELSELLRVVQLFSAGVYGCDGDSEDGFSPVPGGCDDPDDVPEWDTLPDDSEGELPEPQAGQQAVFVDIIFVWCPPGGFLIGAGVGDTDARPIEQPLHSVTLSRGFWISKYEITQGQWRRVMGSHTSYFVGGDRNPAENMSWIEVQDFLANLNAQNPGMEFRLPTEAEWEYACRAGTAHRFPWGDDPTYEAVNQYAWYDQNSWGRPHTVGTKLPNRWGIHDMNGNVCEWVQDWLGPYTADPLVDPTGPAAGSYRVARGGCWGLRAYSCRSAYRSTFNAPDGKYSYVGFRLAKF